MRVPVPPASAAGSCGCVCGTGRCTGGVAATGVVRVGGEVRYSLRAVRIWLTDRASNSKKRGAK